MIRSSLWATPVYGALADAVALGRPDVVVMCPAGPQDGILAELAARARAGSLPQCRFISAESDFGAMSAAMAAASRGDLVYAATASSGLVQASEAVFGSADLRLPIVMTFAGPPPAAPGPGLGWIRLHATTHEEVAGLHMHALELAREFSMPVLVAVALRLSSTPCQGTLDPTGAVSI